LEECTSLLFEHGDDAKILAGGQSLIPLLNLRLAHPSVLIDINRIRGLGELGVQAGGEIRAVVRQRAIESHPVLIETIPVIVEAVRHIAHPQIRSRGTVVGSLAHNDPSGELPAAALVANARFHLVSKQGERDVSAGDFFEGVFSTALRTDELVAHVFVPPSPPNSGDVVEEFARRPGDYAIAGIACRVRRSDDTVGDVNIATFGVGGGAQLHGDACAGAIGHDASKELWREIAERVSRAVEPHSDAQASASFRRHLVRVLVEAALTKAWDRSYAP
jgi:carbon-monoxide dehydrogenase medium subunit